MTKEEIQQLIRNELKSGLYTARKLTDFPTDGNQVTPRKYVNLNGTVATRPSGSIATIGQKYFATDTGIPMTFSGTNWRDGVGSVVAIN